MAMSNLQQCPLKLCLIKYELDIHVFVYFVYFFCGFFANGTCALLAKRNQGEIIRIKHFKSENDVIFA